MSTLTYEDTFPHAYIKYHMGLKPVISSPQSLLILGRLEYWFSKYKAGFYKFLEPCSHPLYKQGDSWAEEMSIARKVFNRAFDKIGVRYKSRTEFLNASDPFQGKLYASYYDRYTNQTYFLRNHQIVDELLKKLLKPVRQLKKSSSEVCQENNNSRQKVIHKPLRNGHNGCSSLIKQRNINISKTTSLISQSNIFLDKVQIDFKKAEEMKEIWIKEIGDLGIGKDTNSLLKRLYQAFKTLFDESLERWQAYCKTIASSKFLMGEVENTRFKIWIQWALKREAVERIEAGEFGIGTREINPGKENQGLTKSYEPIGQYEEERERVEQEIEASTHTEFEKAVSKKLLSTCGVAKYKSWLKDLTYEETPEGRVRVGASSPFIRNWVENNFCEDILACCQEINPTITELHFTESHHRSKATEIGERRELEKEEKIIEASAQSLFWKEVSKRLLHRVGVKTYKCWLARLSFEGQYQTTVTLKAASEKTIVWLKRNYLNKILECCQKVDSGIDHIELVWG